MAKLAKVEAEDCGKQLRRIRVELDRLLGERRKSDFRVATLIHEVWSRKLWRARHRSFIAYVRAELGGMSVHYANKYWMLIEAGFTRKDFERVGMSKLVRVLRVPLEHRDAVLTVAGKMTRDQIETRVKELRGVCIEKDPRASVTLVGEVAASIMRLADTMGVTPQRYVELMVTARFNPSRAKVA